MFAARAFAPVVRRQATRTVARRGYATAPGAPGGGVPPNTAPKGAAGGGPTPSGQKKPDNTPLLIGGGLIAAAGLYYWYTSGGKQEIQAERLKRDVKDTYKDAKNIAREDARAATEKAQDIYNEAVDVPVTKRT